MSGAINTLIVACVFSWLRLMTIFPVSSTFGPLFFIIAQLFTRDFALWVVLFAIFAVSFQIGFSAIARQANLDPLTPYPNENGTFPITYFSIIGDFSYIMPEMSTTPIGVAFLGIYTFIAQVMLVNLLIAMMGDTYTTVRQNSDVEWKCYRRVFVRENKMAPALPPPLNLTWYIVYLPLKNFILYIKNSRICVSAAELTKEHVAAIGIRHHTPRPPPLPSLSISESRDSQASSSYTSSQRIQHASPVTFHPQPSQLIDTELDEAEDIAKVMRVTLDKISEKNEREESESALAQIKKAKKVLLAESATEKNLASKIEGLHHMVEHRGANEIGKQLSELETRLHESLNDKLADQAMKINALEKQLKDANEGIASLIALFHTSSNHPLSSHPTLSILPPQNPSSAPQSPSSAPTPPFPK